MTARRSLSIQTLRGLQALGFVLYSDTHTLGRGQVDLERYPRTIFQVESLPRGFSRDSKAFDCIYADEIAQTIGSPRASISCFFFCACVCKDLQVNLLWCPAHVYSPSSLDESQAKFRGMAVKGFHLFRVLAEKAARFVMMDNVSTSL